MAGDAQSVGVGASGVVVEDGRLLPVRQTYGAASGRWIIPNGSLRAGETLDQTALREVREEAIGHPASAAAIWGLRPSRPSSRLDKFRSFVIRYTQICVSACLGRQPASRTSEARPGGDDV